MANPNLPSDQSPPAISAAELRRRLLASTPPPSVPEPVEAEAVEGAGGGWTGTQDLLARLKMLGKSGTVSVDLPRFLIAKYVPDVFRNEPRNIGVVLWSPDGVAARFAGEKPDAPGEVDDAQIPPFVSSAEAYKQWVRYWRREMAKPAIRPATGGPLTPRGSPDWPGALRQAGLSNFLLADGGTLTEPVPNHELPQAVDYLFENCVAVAGSVR
jgi:hypothetical protein